MDHFPKILIYDNILATKICQNEPDFGHFHQKWPILNKLTNKWHFYVTKSNILHPKKLYILPKPKICFNVIQSLLYQFSNIRSKLWYEYKRLGFENRIKVSDVNILDVNPIDNLYRDFWQGLHKNVNYKILDNLKTLPKIKYSHHNC